MNLYQVYQQAGLTLAQFLQQHASPPHAARWQRSYEQNVLSGEQKQRVSEFERQIHVFCMAGTWCGDCIEQCPIIVRVAEASRMIDLRFIDRDENEMVRNQLQICGAPRIPQVVFFSELGDSVSRFGDRTLAKYRQLGRQTEGAACAIGNVSGQDDLTRAVIDQWLDEFERVHWILKLSPALREIHKD